MRRCSGISTTARTLRKSKCSVSAPEGAGRTRDPHRGSSTQRGQAAKPVPSVCQRIAANLYRRSPHSPAGCSLALAIRCDTWLGVSPQTPPKGFVHSVSSSWGTRLCSPLVKPPACGSFAATLGRSVIAGRTFVCPLASRPTCGLFAATRRCPQGNHFPPVLTGLPLPSGAHRANTSLRRPAP